MTPAFDFLNPDYAAVWTRRLQLIQRIRKDPSCLPIMKAYYKLHPWQFVEDWGVTYDPRNVGKGLPATIPFIPFPKQTDLMKWIVDHWKRSKDGLIPKSRDTGVSWNAIALSCTLCLFYEGMAVGFGSRKEEYVDRLDSPKSLFYKARVFMENLPREFRGGWQREKHGAFMRITFPESGSVITGEAGDNIGRGDRAAIYFVDESAHLERPNLAENALSATTDCRIDLSSVNGPATVFSTKRRTWPAEDVFPFHWRDDPRKTQEWYDAELERKGPVVMAQEYDMDENASVSGVVIPNEWIQAAIDAHIKLGIAPTGLKRGALDVADEGKDMNAFAGGHGVLLEYCEAFSGKGSDIYKTTERAFEICDTMGYTEFAYDADGLGAGVRGDAKKINEARVRQVKVVTFRGSASVINPEAKIVTIDNDPDKDTEERLNKDYYANLKAQAWWSLRFKFLRTYRAVKLGHPVGNPDDLICISSRIPSLQALTMELSQPTYSLNGAGKVLINKQPDGSKSPNMADAVMIWAAPAEVEPRGFFDL